MGTTTGAGGALAIASWLAIGLFYAFFLALGWRGGERARAGGAEGLMLARRALPWWLGTLTLIATWVGGGYINGSAEAAFDPALGLVWTQAPWCYALSLILGGVLFAGRMRALGLTTMLDLFERRYGPRVAALLYVPGLLADTFWMAAILCALGATFAAVVGIPAVHGVWISAVVAIAYTMRGGLWSVAYTDALQLACILLGLGLALPFAAAASGGWQVAWPAYRAAFAESARLVPSAEAWRGGSPWGWQWLDAALLLVLGGIPWQVYFQRVLASRSAGAAVGLSVLAGVGCLVMAVPPVCLGIFGATADWSAAGAPAPQEAATILPYVLRYLTPPWIAIVGLSAVAAAVMSSMDSSLLAAASQFAWNVYRPWRRGLASDPELQQVVRAAVLVVGVLATALALATQSVYTLWFLCADLVYVILFPQLLVALYVPWVNTWGAIAGMAVACGLRVLGGESSWGWPSWSGWPWPDGAGGTLFPFRTAAMLGGLLVLLLVSWGTRRWCPPRPVR